MGAETGQDAAVKALEEAVEHATARYRQGLANYFEVLEPSSSSTRLRTRSRRFAAIAFSHTSAFTRRWWAGGAGPTLSGRTGWFPEPCTTAWRCSSSGRLPCRLGCQWCETRGARARVCFESTVTAPVVAASKRGRVRSLQTGRNPYDEHDHLLATDEVLTAMNAPAASPRQRQAASIA